MTNSIPTKPPQITDLELYELFYAAYPEKFAHLEDGDVAWDAVMKHIEATHTQETLDLLARLAYLTPLIEHPFSKVAMHAFGVQEVLNGKIVMRALVKRGPVALLPLEKRTHIMSQAEYRACGGQKCPNCQSEDITGEEVVIDAGTATQGMFCGECEADWTDQYALVSYDSPIFSLPTEWILTIEWPDAPAGEEEFNCKAAAITRVKELRELPWEKGTPSMALSDPNGDAVDLDEV